MFFGELPEVFTTKANKCAIRHLLHLMKENYLLKFFLRNLILITQVLLYLSSLPDIGGFVSSGISLTSWGEGTFLPLLVTLLVIDHNKNTLWRRSFITSTSFALHLFLLGWLKLNLISLLDQLRPTYEDEHWW